MNSMSTYCAMSDNIVFEFHAYMCKCIIYNLGHFFSEVMGSRSRSKLKALVMMPLIRLTKFYGLNQSISHSIYKTASVLVGVV